MTTHRTRGRPRAAGRRKSIMLDEQDVRWLRTVAAATGLRPAQVFAEIVRRLKDAGWNGDT